MNWWGTSNPDNSLFDIYYLTITYLPALSSDPNPGRAVIANSEKNLPNNTVSLSMVGGDDLDLALQKQSAKDYDGAIALYLAVIQNEKSSSRGKYALVKIDECFTQGNKKDFLTFSAQQIKPLVKDDAILSELLLELDAHWYINNGDYNKAINNFSKIQKDYNFDKEIDKATLFRIGAVYAIHLNDVQSAQKIFNEFLSKYPNDPLAGDIDRLLNMNVNKNAVANNFVRMNQSQAKEILPEGNSLSNYPNPFNPTTKISFSIPQKSQIKLKVFDVLGREIQILANRVYEVGQYEVEFNANNLPSGIYFYNLTTGNYSLTKKMLLLK